MTVLVAPVVGPLLGGWITDNISWPWIFYINIPVGLAGRASPLVDLPQPRPGPEAVPLDYVGLSAAGAAGRCAADHDRQGQGARLVRVGEIIALAVVAVVGFLFFLAWELTEKNPIVDLRLFERRNFTLGAPYRCRWATGCSSATWC